MKSFYLLKTNQFLIIDSYFIFIKKYSFFFLYMQNLLLLNSYIKHIKMLTFIWFKKIIIQNNSIYLKQNISLNAKNYKIINSFKNFNVFWKLKNIKHSNFNQKKKKKNLLKNLNFMENYYKYSYLFYIFLINLKSLVMFFILNYNVLCFFKYKIKNIQILQIHTKNIINNLITNNVTKL